MLSVHHTAVEHYMRELHNGILKCDLHRTAPAKVQKRPHLGANSHLLGFAGPHLSGNLSFGGFAGLLGWEFKWMGRGNL